MTKKIAYGTYNALKKRYEKLRDEVVEIDGKVKELMEKLKVLNNKANAIQKYQTSMVERIMKQKRDEIEKTIRRDRQISSGRKRSVKKYKQRGFSKGREASSNLKKALRVIRDKQDS